MTIGEDNSRKAVSMDERFRVLIDIANIANETIKISHPETFGVCTQALRKCRIWIDTKNVTPESLAVYIDADESANPWMQESIFRNDPDGLEALIFLTLVVGYITHYAYRQAGQSASMSEAIVEAGESILGSMVEYGRKYGLLSIF